MSPPNIVFLLFARRINAVMYSDPEGAPCFCRSRIGTAFMAQTLKFDNLCHNFYQHADLDSSGAVLTATKDATGEIIGMALSTTNNNGAPIPLTVPTTTAASVRIAWPKKYVVH